MSKTDSTHKFNCLHLSVKYFVKNAFFEVKREGLLRPGSIIDIVVDRNPETSSTYGVYTITFPDYPEFGEQGYKIIDASSGVNRLQETIKIQIPSHADWIGKHDIIKIDPPGSGQKSISITVKAPNNN